MVGMPKPKSWFWGQTLGDATGIDSGGELDIEELTAGVVAVGADTFAFNDADDSQTYEEAIADLITAIAGTGILATSGVLSIDLDGLGDATVDVGADSIVIIDEGSTGDPSKLESIADLITAIAGTNATSGISAASGVLRVNPHGTTAKTGVVVGDKVIIADSGASNINKSATITELIKIIGETIAGANATSALSEVDGVARVNIGSTTAKTAPVAADSILINDSEAANINKEVTITNLLTLLSATAAGVGLAATTGVLAVDLNEQTGEVVDPAADSFAFIDATDNATKKEAIADFVGLIAGDGIAAAAGVLSIDSNELTAAVVDVANDSFVLLDATGPTTKKEAVADLVSAVAGDGIVAAAGVIATEDLGAFSVGTILFGAVGDCTSITIGAIVYPYDATPVVADGEWAYGADASASATNLAAAINGKTGSPYTATVNSDTVHVYSESVGTAGNVTISRTGGAQPATVENLVGGLAAAHKDSCVIAHTVTANDVDTAVLVNIPLPFTPTRFMAEVRSSTGLQKILTDLFTIGATPDRIILTGDGATHATAGDVITIQAFE